MTSENPLAEDLAHVLAHTRELWETASGGDIFVTGGTGFFGRWLLESFAHVNATLTLDARLVVLSRDPAAFLRNAPHLGRDAGIEFVTGDVRTFDAADVERQLGNSTRRIEFVIHAATESASNLTVEDPLLMLDTVVQGTRNVLDFAVAVDARRFLFTSSGAVYGRQPSEMTHMPEEYGGGPDCIDPSSAYAEGKRLAELLCAAYLKHHGIEAVIARCFAFVGPFLALDAHFAVGNFIRDALEHRAIRIGGDGTPFRSYLHAADLAVWLWTLLFRGAGGHAYNVGSEDSRTIKQIAETVAKVANAPDIQIAQAADPAKPAARYVPRCSRARDELGLEQKIPFEAAVERTIRVIRQQRRIEAGTTAT